MAGSPYQLVGRSAQVALNEFSKDFDQALALSTLDPWALRLGLTNNSRAIRTTYPIPVSAAGYRLRKGDDELRELFERSLSMSPEEWSDGFSALARVVEAGDFIGFAGEPARIAEESARQPNLLVAQMLEANPYLDLYRNERPGGSIASTIRLFADNHPVNIFDSSYGTFDNDQSGSAIDATLFSAIHTRFYNRKGPNGRNMGLRFNLLVAPSARAEEAKDFLESDLLQIAVLNAAGTENVGGTVTNNRHKGTVDLLIADELTDNDVIYAMDSRAKVWPWIVQTGGPVEQITYDKTSEMYKNKSRIGMKFVLTMAVAAALPHAIERITLS